MQPPLMWTCNMCSFQNPANNLTCTMCKQGKRPAGPPMANPMNNAFNNPMMGGGGMGRGGNQYGMPANPYGGMPMGGGRGRGHGGMGMNGGGGHGGLPRPNANP